MGDTPIIIDPTKVTLEEDEPETEETEETEEESE